MEFPDVVFAKVNIERGKVCMRRELTTNEVHCHSRTYDFPNDVILIFQILGLYFDMSWEDSFARSHSILHEPLYHWLTYQFFPPFIVRWKCCLSLFFAQFLRSLERSVKHLSGLRMNAQEMKIRKNPVIAKGKGAIVCSLVRNGLWMEIGIPIGKLKRFAENSLTFTNK